MPYVEESSVYYVTYRMKEYQMCLLISFEDDYLYHSDGCVNTVFFFSSSKYSTSKKNYAGSKKWEKVCHETECFNNFNEE
jgi:hypothetical protein